MKLGETCIVHSLLLSPGVLELLSSILPQIPESVTVTLKLGFDFGLCSIYRDCHSEEETAVRFWRCVFSFFAV